MCIVGILIMVILIGSALLYNGVGDIYISERWLMQRQCSTTTLDNLVYADGEFYCCKHPAIENSNKDYSAHGSNCINAEEIWRWNNCKINTSECKRG